jgi:hypothetical protein
MPEDSWRFPVGMQGVIVLLAAINIVLVRVLFVPAFAFPVMALIAAGALTLALRRSRIWIDHDRGIVVIRLGLLVQRIPLAGIRSAKPHRSGLVISKLNGRQISLYSSRLVNQFRIPTDADLMARGITRAVEDAREASASGQPVDPAAFRPSSNWPMAVLAATGLVGIGAAFLVRFSWPNPVLTVVAILFAVYIGLTGVFIVVFAVWILAAERRVPGP